MSSDLDEKEQNHVRAALNYLRSQLGSVAVVAKALNFDYFTVCRAAGGSKPVSASMAFRVARLLDASLDDLLAGRYRPGACPKCGHMPSYMPAKVSDFTDEPTTVEDAPRQAKAIGSELRVVK